MEPLRRPFQTELFTLSDPLPDGFAYWPDLLSPAEEDALATKLRALPFRPFDFHGYLANREVVSFGYRYDYKNRDVEPAPPIPDFLKVLREKVASRTGRAAEAYVQILINAYKPGAGIGWHRDKAHFGEVVAVSLLGSCRLRFRRKSAAGWERKSATVAPRSLYRLVGAARHDWEHSIPPVEHERYSITFRSWADTAPE
jgi:alkylated DNA repair dioxygenase AlkB